MVSDQHYQDGWIDPFRLDSVNIDWRMEFPSILDKQGTIHRRSYIEKERWWIRELLPKAAEKQILGLSSVESHCRYSWHSAIIPKWKGERRKEFTSCKTLIEAVIYGPNRCRIKYSLYSEKACSYMLRYTFKACPWIVIVWKRIDAMQWTSVLHINRFSKFFTSSKCCQLSSSLLRTNSGKKSISRRMTS